MTDADLATKLPALLRELRYYHETIDYVVLFNDETAASSLMEQEPWEKELIDLLTPVATNEALRELQKRLKTVMINGKQLMELRLKVDQVPLVKYRRLLEARDAVFDAITDASPAKSGGVAAQIVHEYRQWCDELLIKYYFEPNDTSLDQQYDQAREKLVRWIDDIPHSVRNKVDVSEILDADETLFRTAKMRIQERQGGRVANDTTYENIATVREKLFDLLIELQILVSQNSADSDAPLMVGSRRRLEADLHSEMARFARHPDQSFTLIIAVIDRIKAIRTRLGPEMTDSLIRQAAGILAETLRPYDKVYAAGGGKLAMILPNSPAEGGFEAARRCQARLVDAHFPAPAGQKLKITASFGLSESMPEQGWQTLYDTAYKALTAAKGKGNNQCCAIVGGDLIFDEE